MLHTNTFIRPTLRVSLRGEGYPFIDTHFCTTNTLITPTCKKFKLQCIRILDPVPFSCYIFYMVACKHDFVHNSEKNFIFCRKCGEKWEKASVRFVPCRGMEMPPYQYPRIGDLWC